MKRAHVFATPKKPGRVVLVSKYNSLQQLLQDCAAKLYPNITAANVHCFHSSGAEIDDLSQICHEDVLYITLGEEFDFSAHCNLFCSSFYFFFSALQAFQEIAQLKARIQQLEDSFSELKANQEEVQHGMLERSESLHYNDLVKKGDVQSIENEETLLIFVNTRSGGQLGKSLIPKFKKYVNHDRIIELDSNGPIPAYASSSSSTHH